MAQALEATEARRRELIGTVAHELRTPLTGMRGLTEGLLDGVFSIEEAAPDILREIRRLERLTQELSLVTQAEAGIMSVVSRPVALGEITRAALAQFERPFALRELELKLDVRQETVIQVDADRLMQVLVNLLSNALRHTTVGGVRVQVDRLHRCGLVTVQDTGEGICERDLPHVFERFYRSDQSRARDEDENVGVGLTVSQHLVEAMGGRISLSSQVSLGTTVTVEVPLATSGLLSD
ncbi:sensor histidine kinase [Deinococcus humi]|nr:HAMP domain-containing sensor histidine kinase [Deinococcus humi]